MLSLYTNSISVAIQALTVISMSSIADHPVYRKSLLLTFAAIGYIPSILFLFLSSDSPIWLVSAPLAILANVGFGVSLVAMNAYLPGLARESPEVVKLRGTSNGSTRVAPRGDETPEEEPLLSPDSTPLTDVTMSSAGKTDEYSVVLSRTTSRISSMGIASGYGAGLYS